METAETVILGAGQAGLSLSYYLQQEGRDHLVLEKAAQPGAVWRSHRWDSFTLVTPNWSFALPGGEYRDADPHGYMPRDEILQRFAQYAQNNQLPVSYNSLVTSVEPREDTGYTVEVSGSDGAGSDRTIYARNVVVATGLFQHGFIPPFAAEIPADVTQLHASAYRNPQSLPHGAVLVIGSAQSGGQITEELLQAGRKVYLSTGVAPHVPRRYRGRDIYEWANLTGFLDRTVDRLPSPRARFSANPMLSGKDGGRALNLHEFHRKGIILLGRVRGYSQGKLHFAPDLKENLAKADQGARNLMEMVDNYILQAGLDHPPEDYPLPDDAYQAPELLALDLKEAGIETIIWACGFRGDFSLVRLPVTDAMGFPVAPRGVTRFPGLYFLGMPWLYRQKSGLLVGIAEDAAFLAEQIAQ